MLTCDQAFFFQRRAKEKQREARRSVGGQSGFSQTADSRVLYFRVPPKKERLIAGYFNARNNLEVGEGGGGGGCLSQSGFFLKISARKVQRSKNKAWIPARSRPFV